MAPSDNGEKNMTMHNYKVPLGREPVMQVVTHVGGKADYDHHVRYI